MLKITILCDNIVGTPMGIGEHGFSAFVEKDNETILFDTGNGKGIVYNAQIFGKELRRIRKLCISHGHFDHTEGLPQVLSISRDILVYGHPEIFQYRIAEKKIGENIIRRFIGIPYRKEYLESLGAIFILSPDFQEIEDGVFLTGEVPRKTQFEKGDMDLLIPEGEGFIPDPIIDDQSLALRTKKGLVVIFGCAHSGMINTLNYLREMTGEERIHAILGGTHLGYLSEEQLEASIWRLKEFNPSIVAVSHCTGMKPALRLMLEFGQRFSFAHVGSQFQFE
jgi:7,8-dihydropterin-6-yl-methyl-4-(beta-D-ribofuranosyl)aminobenzene 5'-phosphate synthase